MEKVHAAPLYASAAPAWEMCSHCAAHGCFFHGKGESRAVKQAVTEEKRAADKKGNLLNQYLRESNRYYHLVPQEKKGI